MTPAGTIPFEEVEGRTQGLLAWAIFLKQWITTTAMALGGLVVLPHVAKKLRMLTAMLATENLDRLPGEELRKLAEWLRGLHEILTVVSRLAGNTRLRFYGRSIASIQESTEEIGDVLEGIYLSLDPDFCRLVGDAVDQLRLPAMPGAGSSLVSL
jgi:hypothetical protein